MSEVPSLVQREDARGKGRAVVVVDVVHEVVVCRRDDHKQVVQGEDCVLALSRWVELWEIAAELVQPVSA